VLVAIDKDGSAEEERALPRRYSKLGLASFLIGIGFPLLLIIVAVIGLVLSDRIDDTDTKNAFDFFFVILGPTFGGIGAVIVHLLGLALGIAGAFQKERKRVFAILGITFNGIVLILAAGLATFFFFQLLKTLAWH